MRRYQIAFFIALSLAVALGSATAYLWFHPKPGTNIVAASSRPSTALPTAPDMSSPQPAEPKLMPVQLTPQRLQSIGVKTGTVEFKTLHDDVRTTGSVEVDETRLAHVQLRFSGWIQQVFADATWKPVQKGQPLLTIYSPEIAATEQEYLMARQNRELLGRSTVPGVASGSDSLLSAAAERLRQWRIPYKEITQLESAGSARTELEIDS